MCHNAIFIFLYFLLVFDLGGKFWSLILSSSNVWALWDYFLSFRLVGKPYIRDFKSAPPKIKQNLKGRGGGQQTASGQHSKSPPPGYQLPVLVGVFLRISSNVLNTRKFESGLSSCFLNILLFCPGLFMYLNKKTWDNVTVTKPSTGVMVMRVTCDKRFILSLLMTG